MCVHFSLFQRIFQNESNLQNAEQVTFLSDFAKRVIHMFPLLIFYYHSNIWNVFNFNIFLVKLLACYLSNFGLLNLLHILR